MRHGNHRFVPAAMIGIAGTVTIAVTLLLLGETLPNTVPALLLLVPVAVSSTLATWRVGVPTAVLAAIAYCMGFLPPVGGIRVGLTEDVYVFVAFVTVAVAISLLAGRRPIGEPEPLLDQDRAMLLRSVSHDLRTPLNTIHAVAEDLAQSNAYDPDTRQELMAMVASEADRLNRIVGNLLSISRVQAGSFQPELEPSPVHSLIDASIRRFDRFPDVSIVAAVPSGLPEVLADPVQIDQVLANLVENAMQHAPPGSCIEVGARADGSRVRFWVRDEGPGFGAAPVTAIGAFRPSQGGTGLGLTVCRAIVEAHGGLIEILDPAHGACVEFALPLAVAPTGRRSSSGNMAET